MSELADLFRALPELDPREALRRLRLHGQGALPAPAQAVDLAHALDQAGDAALARALCRRLTEAHPEFAPGWARQAQYALSEGRIDQALAWSEQAVRLDPGCAFSGLCRGIVLRAAGRVTDATEVLDRAVRLAPDKATAWSHYGLCLSDQCQHELALNALDQAIRLEPNTASHRSNWLMTAQYDPAATSAVLREQARAFARGIGEQPSRKARREGQLIRVAYLSPDYYNHPVGRLLLAVLQAHCREGFEFLLLSDTRRPDETTEAFRSLGHRFVQTLDWSDDRLAAFIDETEVNVLVDLAGHTAGNRMPLLARRVAPLQLSWLGYAGSTGLANVDAVVLGAAHVTPATPAYFVEPVVTVPGTHFVYTPPDYRPAIDWQPSETVRFACFNNTAKLNSEVMACWGEILTRVPDSTLTLKWRSLTDPRFAGHVRSRLASLGVPTERLALEPAQPHRQLLDRYNRVDIALDPFPFSGGLTTLEALSMGVPVITLPWERPLSRQSAALLGAIGFEQGVARSRREYVDRAVALARDPERLAELRPALRAALDRHRIEHARPVAAGLESIYRRLLDGLQG